MVLPTCVGMVRHATMSAFVSPRSPHVRGDGPRAGLISIASHGSPHVRGDGPFPFYGLHSCELFSPRAWGWSASGGEFRTNAIVLPTCVGMVRS